MVAISPGPLCLRPEDPPAVPVRPAPRGLLHERHGVAHKTRDQIILQKQQMYVHYHFEARRRVHRGSSFKNKKKQTKKQTVDRRNSGQQRITSSLFPSNSTKLQQRQSQSARKVKRRRRVHPELESARSGRTTAERC